MTSATADFATKGAILAEYYGEVTAELTDSCGSGTCFSYVLNGVTQTANIPPDLTLQPQAGDCMHFIAPITYNWGDTRLFGNTGYEFQWLRYYNLSTN